MTGAPMRVIVRPNRSAIRQVAMGDSGPGMRFLVRLGNRVLTNSKGRVGVHTGYLRSTGTLVVGQGSVRVVYRARYAKHHHDGTRYYPGNPYLTDALHEELRRL